MLPEDQSGTALLVQVRANLTHGPGSVKATRRVGGGGLCPRASLYIVTAHPGRQVSRNSSRRHTTPRASRAAARPIRFAARAWRRATASAWGRAGAAIALLALPASAAAAPRAAVEVPELERRLAADTWESDRPRLLRLLAEPGGCARPADVASARDARVRERAVRLLADAGCDGLQSYGPFLADPHPWIVEALVRAIERHRIGAAVPWLLTRLEDGRRIVDTQGSFPLGALAHRALVAVTCQSFHFDPSAPGPARAEAARRFEAWYAGARERPRPEWIRDGIARAREYLEEGSPWRAEGAALLARIGGEAVPVLKRFLERGPADLSSGVACEAEEPPRVTDTLRCVLVVQNASTRRLLMAVPPGGPRVWLEPLAPGGAGGTERRPAGGAEPARAGAADPTVAAVRPDHAADATALLEAFAETVVDLAPGELLQRDLSAGPALAAGRYELRATLEDAAARLAGGPPIVARTTLRFEQ